MWIIHTWYCDIVVGGDDKSSHIYRWIFTNSEIGRKIQNLSVNLDGWSFLIFQILITSKLPHGSVVNWKLLLVLQSVLDFQLQWRMCGWLGGLWTIKVLLEHLLETPHHHQISWIRRLLSLFHSTIVLNNSLQSRIACLCHHLPNSTSMPTSSYKGSNTFLSQLLKYRDSHHISHFISLAHSKVTFH